MIHRMSNYCKTLFPSLPSVLFTCLHLISIQNELTPRAVARAKWAEKEDKLGQLVRSGYFMRLYQGVMDLLGEYSEEPATLPSHDVSSCLQLTHMTCGRMR